MARNSRQADLVPADPLKAPITVVGVGAVGRNVALQLAALGAGNVQLIDMDTVEDHNVCSQGYKAEQIGESKVKATMADMKAVFPKMKVQAVDDRWRPKYTRQREVIFCCVDSIDTRSILWKAVKESAKVWIDGRMLGEQMEVLAATTPLDHAAYEKTLFPGNEAIKAPCAAKSTIYCANVCAGIMVHQFVRTTRNELIDRRLSFHLTASQLQVL